MTEMKDSDVTDSMLEEQEVRKDQMERIKVVQNLYAFTLPVNEDFNLHK
jgi:hypothetical protein